MLSFLLPFASKIIVPSSYPKEFIINDRFYSYKGYHELAYLDHDQFNPDNKVLQKLGLEKEENFFLVRLTAWNSSRNPRMSASLWMSSGG